MLLSSGFNCSLFSYWHIQCPQIISCYSGQFRIENVGKTQFYFLWRAIKKYFDKSETNLHSDLFYGNVFGTDDALAEVFDGLTKVFLHISSSSVPLSRHIFCGCYTIPPCHVVFENLVAAAKLGALDAGDSLLLRFKSYLFWWTEFVRFKNSVWTENKVGSGLPQRSHLCPLLFLTYRYADHFKVLMIIESDSSRKTWKFSTGGTLPQQVLIDWLSLSRAYTYKTIAFSIRCKRLGHIARQKAYLV